MPKAKHPPVEEVGSAFRLPTSEGASVNSYPVAQATGKRLKEVQKMFKRKNRKENKIEPFSSPKSPLSYPVGQAAQMLGISKRTLIRRASAMGLEFEFDGRGRRVHADDIQSLLSGSVFFSKKSNAFFEAESDESLNAFDEENFQAACNLELPISIRVWQRLPSGKGTMLKGDLFGDETYVFVPELIKQKYGSGEYIIRPIENGVLSKKRYRVKIAGTPKVRSRKGIKMENNNFNFASFSENSQAEKEKLISKWLDPGCLRSWWILIKGDLERQKCFLTFEDFISARRSFNLALHDMEKEELELINSIDAYEIFKSHLQRLCQQKEQADDARLGDVREETQILTQMLQEMSEEMKRFYKEQSEKNTLLLFLCAFCLILLLAPILAQNPPQLTQQKPPA